MFTSIIIALVFFGAQLQVPTVLAFPNFASFNMAAPTANTCAVSGCHAGTVSPTSATITFPSASYTPGGPAIPVTITVPGTSFGTWGYQLTARMASNLASAGGFFTAGDNGTTGTTGSSGTFNLTWTPPPAGTTDSVNFYLTGDNTGGVGSNNIFSTAMSALSPAVATPSPTITSFTAGAASITAGKSTTLTAVFSNGTGSVDNNVGTVTTNTGVTVTPSATTTYTLTVTGGGKSVTKQATVTVTAAVQPPTITSFAPAAATITAGSSTTLTAVFSNGTGTIGGVGTVTSGTPVSVTPSATTTYTLTVTNTATPPATATASTMVTVNPPAGSGTLTVNPTSLAFSYQMGATAPSSKTLMINSSSGSISYTAKVTDPWLAITPTSGTSTPTTPGSIRASVNPSGMVAGTYGAQINITTTSGTMITVAVSLTITSGTGGTGGGTSGSPYAQPYRYDPSHSGALAAAWVANMGASPLSTTDPTNRGLVLATSASAPTVDWAGAIIQNVTGMSLTEFGFDFNASIPCGANSPKFVVVTTDMVSHTVGGCTTNSTIPASAPPAGWTRLRFSPSQATPPISSTAHIQSISLELGYGSASSGGLAVIDNIEINRMPVAKAPTTTWRDE